MGRRHPADALEINESCIQTKAVFPLSDVSDLWNAVGPIYEQHTEKMAICWRFACFPSVGGVEAPSINVAVR